MIRSKHEERARVRARVLDAVARAVPSATNGVRMTQILAALGWSAAKMRVADRALFALSKDGLIEYASAKAGRQARWGWRLTKTGHASLSGRAS